MDNYILWKSGKNKIKYLIFHYIKVINKTILKEYYGFINTFHNMWKTIRKTPVEKMWKTINIINIYVIIGNIIQKLIKIEI